MGICHHRKVRLRARVMGMCCQESLAEGLGDRNDSSWVHKLLEEDQTRASWKGLSHYSTGKQRWNVPPMIHGWKSVTSREDTVLQKILKHTNNTMLLIVIVTVENRLSREIIWNLFNKNTLLPSWYSITNIDIGKWQKSKNAYTKKEITTLQGWQCAPQGPHPQFFPPKLHIYSSDLSFKIFLEWLIFP